MGKPRGVERTVTIVATKRGGVGKSTVALLAADIMMAGRSGVLEGKVGPGYDAGLPEIAAMVAKVGREVSVIDVDVNPGQGASNSAIARRLGGAVTPFALAPTEAKMRDNALATHQHFDVLGEAVAETTATLIDCGANVIDQMFGWAEAGGVGEIWAEAGVTVRFVAVAMADRGSLEDALEALERAETAFAGCRVVRFLVLNYIRGDFTTVQGTRAMEQLVGMEGVGIIHLNKCISELYQAFDASNLPPSAILGLTGAEVLERFTTAASEFSSPRTTARRSLSYLAGWYADAVHKFCEAGLITPVSPAKAGAAAPAEAV